MWKVPTTPLQNFWGPFLNEDFDLSFGTAAKALDEAFENSSVSDIASAQTELRAYMSASLTDFQLEEELNRIGLDYLPQSDGFTLREWLEALDERMTRTIVERDA